MSEGLTNVPTFVLHSPKPMSVKAGGGFTGFGGVVMWKDGDELSDHITLDPQKESGTHGVGFSYKNVARIHVDGQRKWTNFTLPDAPKGRQDICETGILRVELFDTEKLKQYVDDNRAKLKQLGLDFIR